MECSNCEDKGLANGCSQCGRRLSEGAQTITVEVRNVYGENKIYPVCKKAKAFAAIAGTKTLTAATIGHLDALGFSVRIDHGRAMDAVLAGCYA